MNSANPMHILNTSPVWQSCFYESVFVLSLSFIEVNIHITWEEYEEKKISEYKAQPFRSFSDINIDHTRFVWPDSFYLIFSLFSLFFVLSMFSTNLIFFSFSSSLPTFALPTSNFSVFIYMCVRLNVWAKRMRAR